MKEEALKLAVWLENMSKLGWADNFGQELDEISAMIRRLVEELDKQEYRRTHESFSTIIDKVTPQTKPLSEKDVDRMFQAKMSEFTSQKDFEGSVDSWLKSHPDVKGQMAKDLYSYLENFLDFLPNQPRYFLWGFYV